MDESFLNLTGLAKANTLKMMRDRGAELRDPARADMEPLDIAALLYASAQRMNVSLAQAATETFFRSDDGTEMATVVFVDRNYDFVKRKEKMVSTDQIKQVFHERRVAGKLLVVLPFKLSPQARKEAARVGHVELLCYDDLVYDIPRHCLYMPHEEVDDDTFRAETGGKQRAEDLPKMLRTDAVARWFGWPSGTLVRIRRPEGHVYRVVD